MVYMTHDNDAILMEDDVEDENEVDEELDGEDPDLDGEALEDDDDLDEE